MDLELGTFKNQCGWSLFASTPHPKYAKVSYFLWRDFVPSLLLLPLVPNWAEVRKQVSKKCYAGQFVQFIFEKIEIYNFKLWKVRPLLLELQVEGAGCRMEIMASRRLGWSQFETWILRRWHRKHIWNLLTPFTREKAKRTYFQF